MNTKTPPKPLYLLYPEHRLATPPEIKLPRGYRMRTFEERDRVNYQALLAAEGWKLDEEKLASFLDIVLPQGIFFIVEERSEEIVATACAVHNPQGGHWHFPFGGDLGYVITRPEHRGRGLATAACAAAVSRMLSAGYTSIRVGTNDHRLSALKVYLNLGFEPFCYAPGMEERWSVIEQQLRLCER
ncbi:GNAT family N-acetyltransferase [Tumebacillus lipolyticus]|uniref:GNAT family N-acetyltransferase n=1 Tax=Tumebacillus lipolyticus TaxID=1280370 RepID=A0ABW4ZVE5_9BACL